MMQSMNTLLLSMYIRLSSDRSVIMTLMIMAVTAAIFTPEAAYAGLPWEDPICQVALSLSGPVAKAAAVIAIVVTGLLIAFAEVGGIFKTLLGVIFGVCFALLANSWLGFIKPGASSGCAAQ